MRGPERTLGAGNWRGGGGNDLGPPPTLRLELEHFLETPTTSQGTRERQSFPPELSIGNYEKWLE